MSKRILFFILFSWLAPAAFSGFCAAENRHSLHLPLRSAEGHVLRALEWQ